MLTKEAKEQDRAKAEKRKKNLEDTDEKIKNEKEELDKILGKFTENSDEQLRTIKSTMFYAINDSIEMAKNNPKKYSIREEIQERMKSAGEECMKVIDENFADSRKEAAEIENRVKDFFKQIADEVRLDDDFKVDLTTDFVSIQTDSISSVKDETRWVRNPELDRGFFLFRPFKNLFVEKEIERNYGIDIDDLTDRLNSIDAGFETRIDETLKTVKNNLTNAVEKIKSNMETLKLRIEEYNNRLNNIQKSINSIAGDVNEKNEYEEKLYMYKCVLDLVQKNTDFNN